MTGRAPWKQRVAEEPWLHSLFWTLNRLEAEAAGKPRLGDSATRRDEFVDLGQQPHLDFPASNLASFEAKTEQGKARLRAKFLGMLGPMGPLPSHMTEEALEWFSKRDDAFVRFLDIFNNRFLQLFYRAHSDARPTTQMQRPDLDRFRDYVGSAVGLGGESWRDLDTVPDYDKFGFAGLLSPRGASASRIEYLVSGVFGLTAEVEEFVGAFLPLSKPEQTRLGTTHARLGDGAMVGERVLSVDGKIRLRLFPETLENYEKFLPGAPWCEKLVDTMSNAIGFEYEWDVELVLPDHQPKPTQLGGYGRLGWTSWMRKPKDVDDGTYVKTRFSPTESVGGTIHL